MTKGIHIVFEGPDGVGKSTQIKLIKKYLEDAGKIVTLSREPGSAGLGVELRRLLLDTDIDIVPRAEALMMAADRAQCFEREVLPALERGEFVISDRHVPSSLVYQGVVRGLGVEEVIELSVFAKDGHEPDVILCFDLEDEIAQSRISDEPDRIEREGENFQQQVREAYRALTKKYAWEKVDANGTQTQVFDRIKKIIDKYV